MNLDLTFTCIDLSWTDASTAEGLIRMIVLSHTDDKMTLSLKKRDRTKALPTLSQENPAALCFVQFPAYLPPD
jgi:hypothetical protein